MVNDPSVSTQVPFVFVDNSGGSSFQKLDVHLLVRGAIGQKSVERQSSFIARNSNRSTVTGSICTDSTGKAPRS